MENKEIYMDGVDVSGCEYYCERYCKQVVAEDGCYVFLCAEDENCHYKKWQRKEQECEELKEEIAKATMEICNQCGEKDDYNIPCKQIRDLDYGLQLEIEENDKLKQTLTEIKEIAEKIDDSSGCAYGDYDCDNCSSLEQETVCTYKVKKLILQKISEVEDES